MALQKQLVDIQLQGLDTKADPKHVVLGKMLELQNVRFAKTGRISKRFGTSALEFTSDEIKRLYSVNGGVYAIKSDGSTGETFQRRGHAKGNFTLGTMAAPKATSSTVTAGFKPYMSSPLTPAEEPSWTVDSARLDASTIVYATAESDGVRVTWYDTNTNTVIGSYLGTGLAGTVRVRIMHVASKVLVCALNSACTTLSIYEYTLSSATLRATNNTLYDTWPSVCWDWCSDNNGSYLYVGFVNNLASNRLAIWQVNTGTWATATSTVWIAGTVFAIGIAAYTNVRIFWTDGNGLNTRTYDPSLTNTLGTTLVSATGGGYALAVDLDSSETAYVAWNRTAAGASGKLHNSIRYAQVDTAGVPGTITATRGVGLASKIYRYNHDGTNRIFVLGMLGLVDSITVTGQLEEQRGFVFLEVSSSRALRARLHYPDAGICPSSDGANSQYGINSHGTLVNLHQIGSNSTEFGCAGVTFDSSLFLANTALGLPGYNFRMPTGRLLRCVMTSTEGYFAAEQDGCLLVTGGVLHSFDGATMREAGYVTYPKITKLAQLNSGDGACADGTYSVVAVYERIDARGRVVRSAVSPPVSITIASGSDTAEIVVSVTPYHLGLTTSEFERIVIYRTAPGGTTYRRDTQAPNNTTVDEQTINISSTAASFSAAALLYTAGGEADHWQPSAPVAIAADKGWIYAVSGDDPYNVTISKPIGTGESPAFIPEYARFVDSDDGPITAIARMDGKTLAFKGRRAYVANGDGPDASETNDTHGDFELLTRDFGAANQRSVLVGPAGTFVASEKGIRLVGRDLSGSYIGAGVESYTDLYSVVDACLTPDSNEARFILSSGDHELVFNWGYNAWSVNTGLHATACVSVDGTRYLRSTGDSDPGIYYENDSVFTDANNQSTEIAMSLITGWLKFAGLQGYQRLYELLFLGEFRTTDHELAVSLAFDYVDSFTETHQISSANITAGSTAYQFKIRPAVQKCQAAKIRITETASGEDFNLAAISALVGIKRGAAKLASAKVV